MLILTYLPAFITAVFRGMPGVWKNQHRLLLCWLIVLQAVYPGRKTREEMHRWSPPVITAWRFRRLLTATSWSIPLLIAWLADDVIQTLPAPADGSLSLIGDGRHTDKRGAKHPVAQKGRISQHHPWFFGVRFVLLRAAWDVDRIPVAFRIMLPKTPPGYCTENALFRDMLSAFKPPAWATQVIVEGDAAYSSAANSALVKHLDTTDRSSAWHLVCALASTGKTVEEKTVKNLVQHLPRCHYQRPWIPGLSTWQHRKPSWVYAKRLCLRDIGDVTVGLSKTGRNVSPENTKLLVTNRPHVTARQVVWLDQTRWSVERINRDLQSALGLGEHQVRGPQERLEKSFGMAILAYVFVLKLGHQEITPGKPWSLSGLQHSLRLRVMTNQVEHDIKGELAMQRKVA
jgi:DDE family transposase